MSWLRYDSPLMVFISKVTDFIILNFLWVICSIPLVTIGAATTAKYTIAMRILRNEESPVIKPFFVAFKENFAQATKIWLILMLAVIVVIVDWTWIYSSGFANVSIYYIIAVLVISFLVIGVCMSVFPFIARFTVTTKEAIKAGVIYTFLHFVKIVLIALLEFGTIIASLWYANWLIVVALFGTTSAFYFNAHMAVKEFAKTEEKLAEETSEE